MIALIKRLIGRRKDKCCICGIGEEAELERIMHHAVPYLSKLGLLAKLKNIIVCNYLTDHEGIGKYCKNCAIKFINRIIEE